MLQFSLKWRSCHIRILFTLLLALLIGFSETAISSSQKTPTCLSTAWPSELSRLAPDPSLVRGRLDNGFRYVLKQNHEPKNRVAIYLDVQAGSLDENEQQRGLAHFLEHMMFDGSKHFPKGRLVEYFQSLGMNYGGDTNAHTTHQATIYNIILPNGSKKDLDSGLLVMADYARGALLLPSAIDKERGVILAEKRTRDSAEYRTYVAGAKFAFRGTRYAERMPIGKKKVLESADRDLLKSFYDAWYRPNNMILVAVGDFDVGLMKELIEKHFAKLSPSGPKPKCPDFGKLSLKGTETFYYYEPDLGKTNVSIQNFKDLPIENDSIQLERRELLRILGSMAFNFRLQRLQEEGKVPYASAGYDSGDIVSRIGYASLSAQVEAKRWQETLSYLEQILRQAISYGFRESEIERAKKEILSQLDTRVSTAPSEDSRTIANRIIDDLNSNRVYQSAVQEKSLYGPLTKEISAEEVNKQFRERWNHNSRLISVTGDVRLGKNGAAEIASVYQSSSQQPVAATVNDSVHKFPYLQPAQGNPHPKNRWYKDIGVERLTFANGLIVNLKKTHFEDNRIRVRANFGAGKQNEKIPGEALLAEDVINESGSGQLTESEIEELIAGSSVDMNFSVGESAFSWTGTALAKDFEPFSQLLYTLLLDPGFRKSIFTKVKANLALMYQKISQEIEGAYPLEVQPFLANYNNKFGLPPWKDIASLDFTSLSRWAKPLITPKDLEISVVGDFDRDEVVSVLTKYFAGLALHPPKAPESPSVHFPEGKKLAVMVDTSINKALITVAWPTDDFWDIHRARRLQLLADVFGDRLRKEIRQKMAAAYSPSVSSFSSRVYQGYGYIITQMVVKPGSEETVIKEIFAISDKLQKKGITEEELIRAKDPLITSLKEHIRTNQYWLNSVLSLSARHPQQLDWPTTIINDYTAISTQEINKLAKKYLDNARAAVAKVKPDDKVNNEGSPVVGEN